MPTTSTGIAHDRRPGSVADGASLLFLHAGVADRRMWDSQWTALPPELDLTRLDLRGFGESGTPPSSGAFSHTDDVLATMDELRLARVHLVGSSFGAGVAVEVALTAPERVTSLVLCPPGGSLIATLTDSLRDVVDREVQALDRGDIDAAVEANIDAWLVGRGRTPTDLAPSVLDQVRRMQRDAFEVGRALEDVEEIELDPPALERLADVTVPVLVLTGAYDMDTIHEATDRVSEAITTVTTIAWTDVAHLPSLERPRDFAALVSEWIARPLF